MEQQSNNFGARRPGSFSRPHGRQGTGSRPQIRTSGTATTPSANRSSGGRPPARSTSHSNTPRTSGTSQSAGTRRPHRARVQKGRSRTSPALTHRPTVRDPKVTQVMPVTDPDVVRIIPLGGVEEVGKNMTAVETADDILIFDAGFQFVSSESDAPGVNYILPNTQYLEENKHKIRGLIITHGHLDHIGGIPFLIERIGNPPIYTRYLTSLMVLKRQEEFPHLPKVNMNVVELDQRIKIGNTYVKAIPGNPLNS
jgi:ribonuclease J